jgi:hypothetical protein
MNTASLVHLEASNLFQIVLWGRLIQPDSFPLGYLLLANFFFKYILLFKRFRLSGNHREGSMKSIQVSIIVPKDTLFPTH